MKKTTTADKVLLKKSSLDIPLLSETEDDRQMASLLSMKLKPQKSITETTELNRKRLLLVSSLPTTNFTLSKEVKAVKLLNQSKDLGIVKKRKSCESQDNIPIKTSLSLVGDYSSSGEESNE